MTVIFENPGEIDPRCITTLGVNVKDSDSPIGYFGTGLKYAIAVMLRLGQGVTIHVGGRVHAFTLKDTLIRGKQFQIICMNGVELGFTTELGKNWELWMAYRELWSNAMDEGGRVYQSDELADVEASTQIVVDGLEFDGVHFERSEFLLIDRLPVLKTPELEIYHGPNEHVFYRGIRAGKIPNGTKSRFTYNIIEKCDLTEDRTLASNWEVNQILTRNILGCEDQGYLTAALTELDENTLEARIEYDQAYTTASETFVSTVQRLLNKKTGRVNERAVSKYKRQTAKNITPEGRPATQAEAETIEKARAFAERAGFSNSGIDIKVSENLGDGILALAIMKESTMLLSPQLFTSWQHVAQAIIEESIHIRTGYPDCSRGMQTHLFEEIMRLAQAVQAVQHE